MYWFSYYNRGDANSICGKNKKKNLLMSMCLLYIIVFRPGPVQGPCSGFWPGHWVARVNYFFSNQNDVVLVKKKQKATGCNRVFDRVNRVTPGFSFSHFFFTWPGSSPGSAGPRATLRSGRGFKTMLYMVVKFVGNLLNKL